MSASAKLRGVQHLTQRALDSYQRARQGVPLTDVTRGLADMGNLGAMVEVATYAIAQGHPGGSCCNKCAAERDADEQGYDVLFIKREREN